MINFNFNISSPWHRPFNAIKSWTGKTLFANKFWELEIYRDSTVLSFTFSMTVRQDHAGLRVELGLLGYCAQYTFYDNRHWDYNNSQYCQEDVK